MEEASIGTVVDRITASYVKFAVVTNINRVRPLALEQGFPEEWGCHVHLTTGRVVWTNKAVAAEVFATPGAADPFDSSIPVSIMLDQASNLHASVLEVEKLRRWLESQNLDDGLIIPMDWSGDPDDDAFAYLMVLAPVLRTIGGE